MVIIRKLSYDMESHGETDTMLKKGSSCTTGHNKRKGRKISYDILIIAN